ncbi:MAG: phytanoyl-CoA dioxygenase family protein [Candidatus Dormibacteria bacterium]
MTTSPALSAPPVPAPAGRAAFFEEHGWLHVPGVFSASETDALAADLDRLISTWATRDRGWVGSWRHAMMDVETEAQSQLVALHDLQLYSAAWASALLSPRMAGILVPLLGPNVELHHSTMHVKPPQTGHPFPPHQDQPFYEHENDRFVDVLVHLDDTSHANGEIRFTDASHRLGPLPHVRDRLEDRVSEPYLPMERFPLERMVAVPARRGDVVLFSINTVHGSYVNRTDRLRRLVRVGYRDPANRQVAGDHLGRPGLMLAGFRDRD